MADEQDVEQAETFEAIQKAIAGSLKDQSTELEKQRKAYADAIENINHRLTCQGRTAVPALRLRAVELPFPPTELLFQSMEVLFKPTGLVFGPIELLFRPTGMF